MDQRRLRGRQDTGRIRTAAVVATLADAVAEHDGPVLVPMTLVNPRYFDEIMSGLHAADVAVQHFSLIASPATLRRRLRTRSGYWLGRAVGHDETWAMAQIPRCVDALATDRFARHIETDELTVHDVVETIAAQSGLTLIEPRMAPLRYQLRRLHVGLEHIR